MKYTPSLKYNPRVRLLLLVLIFFFVKYHLQMSILRRGVSLKDKERLLLFFLTCQYYKRYSSRTSSLHKGHESQCWQRADVKVTPHLHKHC